MDLSQIPAFPPPPGVVPNFEDPESLAPICRIVIWITLPLMLIFLGLRVYVRLRISHKTGADDILCLISAAIVITFCAITLSFLDNPVGPHQWNVPVSKITLLFRKLTVISIVNYAVGCMAVKATLLVLYLRVFSPNPRAKALIWLGLVFNVVFYTISVIVDLIACLPHPGDGGWSDTSAHRCETQNVKFAEAQGVIGAVTDLYVLFIPMTMLAGLHLSRRRKIGIYGVFFTGFLACVVSIINAVFRFKMFQTGDALWNEVPIYALCAAELNIGMMCACMPVIFVMFKGVAQNTLSWAAKLKSWTTRSKSDVEMQPYVEVEHGNLPQVPRGTLRGLRSFMQRVHRSRPTDTGLMLTQPSHGEVLTYVSTDYDYHTHLARQDGSIAGGPSSKKWQLSRTYKPSDKGPDASHNG